MTAGIERIHIVSDWRSWRLDMAHALEPAANDIYFSAFADIGLTLLPGVEVIECEKDELAGRYDWQEGIDVILHFQNGQRATLQEKFLTFWPPTATFEEETGSYNNRKPGAWYSCTAQYYFVGYARNYKDTKKPPEERLKMTPWVLIDFPGIKRCDAQGLVHWGEAVNPEHNPLGIRQNARDRATASFRYVAFNRIPEQCIVARGGQEYFIQPETEPHEPPEYVWTGHGYERL